ncbi:hypothetical protein QE152_g37719 [Popillia japonica]|uniref:Uncharacterized protein n=1 Tax=Popillia japonica TaxID=7064 RepID=A0AAW1I8V8_POPJA
MQAKRNGGKTKEEYGDGTKELRYYTRSQHGYVDGVSLVDEMARSQSPVMLRTLSSQAVLLSPPFTSFYGLRSELQNQLRLQV